MHKSRAFALVAASRLRCVIPALLPALNSVGQGKFPCKPIREELQPRGKEFASKVAVPPCRVSRDFRQGAAISAVPLRITRRFRRPSLGLLNMLTCKPCRHDSCDEARNWPSSTCFQHAWFSPHGFFTVFTLTGCGARARQACHACTKAGETELNPQTHHNSDYLGNPKP